MPKLRAQSSTPAQNPAQNPPPSSNDNPFPEDAPKTPAQTKPAQSGSSKPDSTTAQPKKEGDNPFPGEDTDAPIIPAGPEPNSSAGSHARPDAGSSASTRREMDGDPVRSPDLPGHFSDGSGGDDGFSSSLSGMNTAPAPDESNESPSKLGKNKTRVESVKEDVNVGGFYLAQKNWKAAQARFASAFALDAENPDAVWGLAEAERHLRMYKEADEHYKLFLTYDPDGPHGKAARKALEEVEAALTSSPAGAK